MIRLIPPIAVPLRWTDVTSSLSAGRSGAGPAFAAALASSAGVESATLFGSGRAAMTAFLKWSKRPGRDEVVIPGYTCWSVPAAVVRAGMKVRWADIDPSTLDLDPSALSSIAAKRTACVVLGHLFGRSCNVSAWVERIRAWDPEIRILEDAAQAWPRVEVSAADAVVLSFARGKPISLGGGGALLHPAAVTFSAPSPRRGGWGAAAGLLATSVLAKPAWYRIPESLPFIGIGTTVYEPGFPVSTPFRHWQESLGSSLLDALPGIARARTQHATEILRGIARHDRWTIPAPARSDGPIRLPLLAPSRRVRGLVVMGLRRRGVAASPMYPGTIADIESLQGSIVDPDASLYGARQVADTLLTLPVYPGLSAHDIARIVRALDAAVEEAEP